MATFDEILEAFFFVSSDECGMNRALLCLDNGKIYYHSEMVDLDELDEDKFDCDHFIEIPHKGLLKIWHNFENQRVEKALLEWALENEVELKST